MTDNPDKVVFTGHMYGIGRNKSTIELAGEIRADLECARQVGKLPLEVRCAVTPLCLVGHSNTIMIVADGPVHAAEYATVLRVGNAYNRTEETPEGWRFHRYRLEVYAPASPEVRAHPATALIEQLGALGHEWRDLLTGEEREAVAVVQRGLERAATEKALGTES